MKWKTISIAECREMLGGGRQLNVVDVRTPGEFNRVHVRGAWLMPLDELDCAAVCARRKGPDDPIYVICQSGARAAKACGRLEEAGVAGVYCVEGGTAAWEQSGLPVERGESKVISLERQIRIAAGFLVLAGVILAWRIHPGFMVIPGFVGAGLMFAGISGYCGMGMVLAKMPWNRGSANCVREVTKASAAHSV